MIKTLTGSWSAAELPHRVSQMFVEDVLREEAAACPTVSIRAGWRMAAVRDTGAGVEVEAEHDGGRTTVRAAYAVGADGGASPTRKALGFRYAGESGVVRDFMGGRMFAIHFRSTTLYDVIPHPRAWMYWTVNGDRRAFMATVNGTRSVQLPHPAQAGRVARTSPTREAQAHVRKGAGRPLDIEIIARSAWNAGYTLVAEKFQRGRIFLGGDAVHLFTPAGGLGYNTAIEDAVNLGWKLNAMLKGWGGPALLDTTRSSGRRSPGATRPTRAALPTRSGCSSRRRSSRTTAPPAKRRASLPATTSIITPGSSSTFRASPSAAATTARRSLCRTAPRRRRMPSNSYEPTACPGGRAPHLWLGDGRSLYDALGFEFTLLQLGAQAGRRRAVPRRRRRDEHAARRPSFIPGSEARDLYGADLALIRPDQIVAWRGNSAAGAEQVLRRAAGLCLNI